MGLTLRQGNNSPPCRLGFSSFLLAPKTPVTNLRAGGEPPPGADTKRAPLLLKPASPLRRKTPQTRDPKAGEASGSPRPPWARAAPRSAARPEFPTEQPLPGATRRGRAVPCRAVPSQAKPSRAEPCLVEQCRAGAVRGGRRCPRSRRGAVRSGARCGAATGTRGGSAPQKGFSRPAAAATSELGPQRWVGAQGAGCGAAPPGRAGSPTWRHDEPDGREPPRPAERREQHPAAGAGHLRRPPESKSGSRGRWGAALLLLSSPPSCARLAFCSFPRKL